MNFTSREKLGETLVDKLQQYREQDAVIVCLQVSSLLTCLVMAKHLHAWVFPLVYAPVKAADGLHELLGAYSQDGEFCPNPEGPLADADPTPEMARFIKDERPNAMKAIRSQAKGYDMRIDKHVLNGRHVILVADVITSSMPLAVAQQVLKSVSPKSIEVAVGNASPKAAKLIRITAMQPNVLDVLSGVIFDENRYFELPDTYTPKEKQKLTKHIAAFWQ